MEKKKRFSVLKLLITIICISAIIVSLAVNILFSVSKVPHIFGRYIYVIGDDNPMIGDLTTGAALIAMDAKEISINMGDIVICYPADDPDNLTLRSIAYIAEGDDGSESYYTEDSYHPDNTDSIFKSSIVAVCTGYLESLELGRFITFALSMTGLIVLVGVPALILIIFLISSIISSKAAAKEMEEGFGFYEYDENADDRRKEPGHAKGGDPLYEPGPELAPNPELERKKMSIAENFKQKQVNPDSPYQKEKEKERTVQFKAPTPAQRGTNLGSTMAFSTTSTAESSFAARNPGVQASAAPTADALREEMLRKTAEAERTSTYNVQKTAAAAEPITDNTGILSKAQVAELSRGETSAAAKSYQAPKTAAPAAAPRKSSSPDISDILGQTGSRRAKDPSDMSVDDLLKMIEDQKSRL